MTKSNQSSNHEKKHSINTEGIDISLPKTIDFILELGSGDEVKSLIDTIDIILNNLRLSANDFGVGSSTVFTYGIRPLSAQNDYVLLDCKKEGDNLYHLNARRDSDENIAHIFMKNFNNIIPDWYENLQSLPSRKIVKQIQKSNQAKSEATNNGRKSQGIEYEFLDMFVSTSRDLIHWCFWHASLVIWAWSQDPNKIAEKGFEMNFDSVSVEGKGKSVFEAIAMVQKNLPEGEETSEIIISQVGESGTFEIEGYKFVEIQNEAKGKIPETAEISIQPIIEPVNGFLGVGKKPGIWKVDWDVPYVAQASCTRPVRFGVDMKYGNRENAVLLKYEHRDGNLEVEQISKILGMDIIKSPFTKHLSAHGKNEIEGLNQKIYQGMGLWSQDGYESGDGIPGAVHTTSAPQALHPSKWSNLVETIEEIKSPEFTSIEFPDKNPAVAFSRYANELSCPYCNKLNVAPEWPRHGDMAGFYFQTREDTEKNPGVFKVEVICSFCSKEWFVVWDQDPR